MPAAKQPSRPWQLDRGVRGRTSTYATKKSALGVAVLFAYNSSVGAKAAIFNNKTKEVIRVEHMEGHRVLVTFHGTSRRGE